MIILFTIQLQLDCCGWDGPKEFAYNSEPIGKSNIYFNILPLDAVP